MVPWVPDGVSLVQIRISNMFYILYIRASLVVWMYSWMFALMYAGAVGAGSMLVANVARNE